MAAASGAADRRRTRSVMLELYPRRCSNAGSTAIRTLSMRRLPAAPEVFVDGEWSQRVAAIQAGVRPLRFLAGTWTGEGTSEGEPVRGRLVASLVLDDTFLECSEQLFTATGELDHEDRVVYRYDIENQTLRALHLQAPGWVTERHVDLLSEGTGFVWSGGPTLPRVVVRQLDAQEVQVEVWLPGEATATTRMLYRREDGHLGAPPAHPG